jgi:microcystin degradation protein MlrC
MRIGCLGLYHEANTFSRRHATYDTFLNGGLHAGDAIRARFEGTASILGGYLEAARRDRFDLDPLLFARVTPTGPIEAVTFDRLAEQLVAAVAASSWDGLLLALHGAAVSEQDLDADGELLRRVRATVGPGIPIGCTVDMHANVSARMVDAVDVLVAYQTNPHLDARERALTTAGLLTGAAGGELRPVVGFADPPLAVDILRQSTGEEPMASLLAEARRVEAARPGVLVASVLEGYPYADVPEMGMSVVVVADGDRSLARTAAEELALSAWRRRGELQGVAHPVDQALTEADRLAGREPVVLLDVGDNIGAGAPGDSTVILAEAARRGIGGLLQTLHDPGVVDACARAGPDRRLRLRLGGHGPDSPSGPLAVAGVVRSLSDGRYREPRPTHGGFQHFDAGPCAVVDLDGGATVLVTSRLVPNTSLEQYRSVGIEPAAARIIVAKGVNAPQAALDQLTEAFLAVDTPGVTPADLARLSYRHRRRPMFPFEPEAAWPAAER